MNNFAGSMQSARAWSNLIQAHLAERANLSRNVIVDFEKGPPNAHSE